MKKYLQVYVLVLLSATGFITCKKTVEKDNTGFASNIGGTPDSNTLILSTGDTTVAYPKRRITNCPGGPDYGDSVIFVQPSSSDYIIVPRNQPAPGTYFAWPGGMVIDKHTGSINVTKSEMGLRYNIGYVKEGTTDTCVQTIILAGASYADSIYVISNNERYATPYFNADPALTSICSNSGQGGKSCEFDVTDQLGKKSIKIDKKTGVIDLTNTLKSAFGPLPVNGATVTTTMSYTLNDKSNLATEQITLQLIYYNKKSDVPASLLATVTDKLNKIQNGSLLVNVPGSGQQLRNGNPRPPIIIVTRFAF